MPSLMKNMRFGTPEDPQRWVAGRKLGEGQFAEVFEVRECHGKLSDEKYAVKMEKRKDSRTVKSEYKVLKKLASGACRQICFVVESGLWFEQFFIVMELLGTNLADAKRNRQPDARFAAHHVCSIGLSILAAVQSVHDAGFVHRDVKPANFALHPSTPEVTSGHWYIIDFGLARRYLDDDGQVMPPRQDASFRGSTTYASINAHHNHDLSRRDDLWSWFYILVELLDGNLPWRGVDQDSRDAVVRHKLKCIEVPEELTRNVIMPDCLKRISHYLSKMTFEQEPDYDFLKNCVERLIHEPVQHKARGLSPRPPLPSVSPRDEVALSPEDYADHNGEPATVNGHDPRSSYHSQGFIENGTDLSHQPGPGPGSATAEVDIMWYSRTSQWQQHAHLSDSHHLPRPHSSGRGENGEQQTFKHDRHQWSEHERLQQGAGADSRKRPRRESADMPYDDSRPPGSRGHRWSERWDRDGTTSKGRENRPSAKREEGQAAGDGSCRDDERDRTNSYRSSRELDDHGRPHGSDKSSDRNNGQLPHADSRGTEYHADPSRQPTRMPSSSAQHIDALNRQPSDIQPPSPAVQLESQKASDQFGLNPAHQDAVQRVKDYLSFFSQGATSQARQVLAGFSQLDPVDALACIAVLLNGTANSSAVDALPHLASLLEDIGTYAFHTAQHARQRYATHEAKADVSKQ